MNVEFSKSFIKASSKLSGKIKDSLRFLYFSYSNKG